MNCDESIIENIGSANDEIAITSSASPIELNLLNETTLDPLKQEDQGCFAFIKKTWRKLTELKEDGNDLDSLELYYLNEDIAALQQKTLTILSRTQKR